LFAAGKCVDIRPKLKMMAIGKVGPTGPVNLPVRSNTPLQLTSQVEPLRPAAQPVYTNMGVVPFRSSDLPLARRHQNVASWWQREREELHTIWVSHQV
jgi:hypothetical protein